MGLIPGLPQSDTAIGNTFLMASYGYILLQGANLIGDGSELLLEVLDPGLIGGLVLPILGALPDAAIIAMSGVGGTVEEAQEQVAVGMGTLAGSTVMLLTIAWAGSLVLGRCDLVMGRNGTLVAKEKTLGEYNGPWDLMRTGVTTDDQTRFNAFPMVLSSLLYLVVQVPAFFGYEQDYTAAVMGFVLTLFALAVYCVYQVISPDLQRKKMQAAHDTARRHAMVARVAHLASSSGHALVNADQSLNADAARAIFDKFDSDGNGHLDITEMKALILGLSIGMQTDITESALDEMFKDFDANSDGEVTFDEFSASLTKWCRSKLGAMSHPQTPTGAEQSVNTLTTRLANEATPLCETDMEEGMAASDGAGGESEEEQAEEPLTESQVYQQATTKLLLGALIIALFADPMVDAVAAFAVATDISPFMVSFVVTPFASNASELVTSLTFASRKRKKNISLTYSQVYGAVTMNNTMCLSVFMALVAFRGLDWSFCAETVVTMAAIWLLSIIAVSGTTFQLYLAPVVLLIYPLSLGAVVFLEDVLGFD